MIDRDKVIKGLECCQYSSKSHCDGCPYAYESLCNTNDCTADLASDAIDLLKEHEAKWIYGEDETGVDGWHCSECNFFEPWFYDFTDDIDFIRFYRHCPNCGSKMTSYTGKPTQDRR